MKRRTRHWAHCVICAGMVGMVPLRAQTTPAPGGSGGLAEQVAQLSAALKQTQAQQAESRAEISQLRASLDALLRRLGSPAVAAASTPAAVPPPPAPQLPHATPTANAAQVRQDDWQILRQEVSDLEQAKVESGLQHRLQLSGIVLFTGFANAGLVDNLDAPSLAVAAPPGEAPGTLGASLRQSILGLTGLGPNVFGARSSAHAEMDFFGGLPAGYGATASGIMRLRVARVRLDWPRSSLVAGLDTPFFSPNIPSTYMSVGVPGFAAAGNLWQWTPTLRLARSFDLASATVRLQAGLMDPPAYASASGAIRGATPGEYARAPTTAVRLSLNGRDANRPAALGVAGIYFPQRFENGATISGWGATADWRLPMGKHWEVKGASFWGRGLDSFGGAPVPIVPAQDSQFYVQAAPALAKVPAFGGWAQLQFRLDARQQFNLGAGYGGREARDLRAIAPLDPALASLPPRNELLLINYIYQPWSDFLLSPEYRRLRTFPLAGPPALANQAGLALGFLF